MGVRDGLELRNLKRPSIQFDRKIRIRIPVKETATGRKGITKNYTKYILRYKGLYQLLLRCVS
jgi:hypothetical protein